MLLNSKTIMYSISQNLKSSINIGIIAVLLCSLPFVSYAQYEPIQELQLPKEEAGLVMDISQDGKKLAIGTGSTTQVWNIESGKQVTQFNDVDFTQCVSFSKDGIFLLSSGQTLKTSMYDLRINQLVYDFHCSATPLHGTVWPMNQVYFSWDEKLIYTQGYDVFQVWDFSMGKEILAINQFDNKFYPTRNNSEIIRVLLGKASLFNIYTNEVIRSFEGDFCAISRDRKVIMVTKSDQYQHLIDIDSGQEIGLFPVRKNTYTDRLFDFSYENNILIVGSSTNTNQRSIYTTNSEKAIREYPYDANEKMGPTSEDYCIRIFPDGKKFVTANYTSVYIWDISDLTTAVKDAGKF